MGLATPTFTILTIRKRYSAGKKSRANEAGNIVMEYPPIYLKYLGIFACIIYLYKFPIVRLKVFPFCFCFWSKHVRWTSHMYRRGIGTKRHQEWKRGTTDGKVKNILTCRYFPDFAYLNCLLGLLPSLYVLFSWPIAALPTRPPLPLPFKTVLTQLEQFPKEVRSMGK